MNTVKINVGDEDLRILETIFKNESNFQPKCNEDRIVEELLRQIVKNPKTKIEEEMIKA